MIRGTHGTPLSEVEPNGRQVVLFALVDEKKGKKKELVRKNNLRVIFLGLRQRMENNQK